MILMLIRTLLWGGAILAAALAFVFLKDATGGVNVELNGQVYGPFRPLEFVGVVVVIALLLWALTKLFGFLVALVRFFSGDETALSRYWNRSRERRGFDALSHGLIALAEGDGKAALTRAKKAERLLERPGLTRLLMAQSAEAAGDPDLARNYYKELASDPDTAFVGTRGLLAEALRKGETDRALKLARHAFALKGKDAEVITTLFGLQSQSEDFKGARETLAAAAAAKTLTKDVVTRREAVLLLAEARATDDAAQKRDFTLRAAKGAPGLTPAVVDAAAILAGEGAMRKARNMLQDAWRQAPHPAIAAGYAELAPDETPAERRLRFQHLTKIAPDHPESRMLAAELALADKDWDGAVAALGDLAETKPTARALAIMAAATKGRNESDEMVSAWLRRAVAAPRGAEWVCDVCGEHHEEWMPACESCSAFDTLTWKDPPAREDAAAANAALSPLMDEEASLSSPDAVEAETAPQEADPGEAEKQAATA
ncbi:MAG: heme biosynthesis HemY N-terminal domain-containing protein [Pseudomonadota bacterium]